MPTTYSPRGARDLTSGQAIPETTVNENTRRTEAGACFFPVADRVTTPPGSCSDGSNYIITATATGIWTGKEDQIATALGANAANGWLYHEPIEGFSAYVQDENTRYLFNGSAWVVDTSGGSVSALDDLSDVNAAAPADGDVLAWDDGAGEWVPATPSGGGGGSDLATEYQLTTPTAPTNGTEIFSRKIAGRRLLSQIGPIGWASELQPSIAQRSIFIARAIPATSSNPSLIGFQGLTTGSISGQTPGTGSLISIMNKLRYNASATANSSAGIREIVRCCAGDGSTPGGYMFTCRFGIPANLSGMRWFVGLTGSNSVLTGADPSGNTNLIGFGKDAADSNVQLMVNDGTGSATKTDLGANFPAYGTTLVYEARVFVPHASSTAYVALERLDTSYLYEASPSSDIPSATTLMAPQVWVNSASTGSTSSIDFAQYVLEMPY